MNEHDRRKLVYLLDQLPEDNLGVDMCLQHVTGQELLNKPWYTVERPSHANTPRVYRKAFIGTLMVTFTAFTAANIVPNALAIIPLYVGYVALVLGVRKVQLSSI